MEANQHRIIESTNAPPEAKKKKKKKPKNLNMSCKFFQSNTLLAKCSMKEKGEPLMEEIVCSF